MDILIVINPSIQQQLERGVGIACSDRLEALEAYPTNSSLFHLEANKGDCIVRQQIDRFVIDRIEPSCTFVH